MAKAEELKDKLEQKIYSAVKGYCDELGGIVPRTQTQQNELFARCSHAVYTFNKEEGIRMVNVIYSGGNTILPGYGLETEFDSIHCAHIYLREQGFIFTGSFLQMVNQKTGICATLSLE